MLSSMTEHPDPYKVVEVVWEDGRKCRECRYEHRIIEPHGEQTRECDVLEQNLDPTLCLGFEEAEGALLEGIAEEQRRAEEECHPYPPKK